jgi:hypothetical protein
MRFPEHYWTLFKTLQDRTEINTLVRPGLLYPLYGLPDPRSDYKYPALSANEQYWGEWFHQLKEVHSSLERLDQASVYLTHYPGARAFPFQRLSEAEWIRYHVEVYLQELYILEQRLSRFLRKVEKLTGAGDKNGFLVVQGLKAAVKDGFTNVVRVRSGHVHQNRFQDEEMSNLDLALLFTRGRSGLPMLRGARQGRYAVALKKWSKYMRASNKNLVSACADMFKELTRILARHEPRRPQRKASRVPHTRAGGGP